MDINNIKDYTRTSMLSELILQSPILSGNMQAHIDLGRGEEGYEIQIEAPYYDFARWQKEGVVVLTGAMNAGNTDYAADVNEFGGFFTHNESEHWVNRVVWSICEQVATKFGGVAEGNLPR